jgi:hypothetical protein
MRPHLIANLRWNYADIALLPHKEWTRGFSLKYSVKFTVHCDCLDSGLPGLIFSYKFIEVHKSQICKNWKILQYNFTILHGWLLLPHCKDTVTKIWNKYSQKRNCVASVSISIFMCLWAIYIFPQLVCLFCCRKICGPILVIYKSLIDTWMC